MAGPNQNGRWYEPVNPNEHSYTPGYGFSTRPPFLVEQRLILGYSSAAAFVLLGFLFLYAYLRTRNLASAILLHMAVNLIAAAAALVEPLLR